MANETQETPKPAVDGKILAEVPQTLVASLGEQGVAKGAIGSLRITTRQLFLLRKQHAFLSAVHNAIIKQVKKVEIYVDVIDKSQPYSEETKARMEKFAREGFMLEGGEKTFRALMVDVKKYNGDSWAEIVFGADANHEPLAVKYLYADTMRIFPNDDGTVAFYPQVVDGETVNKFAPENILRLSEHHDEYSLFCWSDIESLIPELLLDTLATDHSIAKLENDALPPGMLNAPDENDETQIQRLRALIITQHRQAPNKPLLMGGRMNWIPFGNTALKDMDFQELHRSTKEKIMMVYSVLPMQVSVVETGRLANPEQQLEIGGEYIWQELQAIEEQYNLKFTPYFKDSGNLAFRFGDMDPKLDSELKNAQIEKLKAETAQIMTATGQYTKNEIRAITGHDEALDGHVTATPPASFPVGSPPAQGDPSQTEEPKNQEGENKSTGKHVPESKPFAGYDDFADCVDQNSDKENPEAYCASIMRETESNEAAFETKSFEYAVRSIPKAQTKMNDKLTLAYAKFTRQAIKIAKENYPSKKKTPSAFDAAIAIIIGELAKNMEDIAKSSATGIYKESKASVGFGFTGRDERVIQTLLGINGGAFDAVKSFTKEQREGFVDTMKTAFEEGLDIREMVKSMQEYSDAETWQLEMIARTETHRFANQGRIGGYKDLEEERGEKFEYDWRGPDDDRTSEECKEILDGNPYELEEIERITYGGVVHPNERHVISRRVK